MSNPLECFTKSPLILSFSGQARLGVLASFAAAPAKRVRTGRRDAAATVADSLSHPHPLADAGYPSGKLAKASLLGEGWGEGVFC
jgi:hypothetical protein